MSTSKYPNRDTLRKANDIYLDVMRSFIIHHLKQVKGERVEDLIEDALHDNQVDKFVEMLDEHKDVELAIDFNHIPQIIKVHWNHIFAQKFDNDLVNQSRLWLIRQGRNSCEHRGPDLDPEFTRTHLFIIAELLGKINRSDKQQEVVVIRDQFLTDNAAKQISDISGQLEVAEAEKKKYKNELSETKQHLEELKIEQTGYKEKIEALTDVEKEKNDVEERLATVSKDLKAAEDAWSECDECLTTTSNQLKKVEEQKTSLEEHLASIEKHFEDEKQDYKEHLTSIKDQLVAVKFEKKDTEKCLDTMRNQLTTVAIANQIFPSLSTDSAVRILDHRNTDKKNYLLELLELKQSSIIYVLNEEKINQFLNLVGPEQAEVIGKHNEQTSDAEETELLEKLKNGDLIAIVSNTTFSALTTPHPVEHFVFCHLSHGINTLFTRCQPAFTSHQNAYLHLIYNNNDHEQDIKLLTQEYPDKEALREFYKDLKNLIGINENFVDSENICEKLEVGELKFETCCAIFEELRLLERNEEGIKLLQSEKKELEESKLFCDGEKRKQKIKESHDFQLEQSVGQIWEEIVEKLYVDSELNLQNRNIHSKQYETSEIENNDQQPTAAEKDTIISHSPAVWPQRTFGSFASLRQFASKNFSESNTLLREEDKQDFSDFDRRDFRSSLCENLERDNFLLNQDYKNCYNLAMQFLEDHGINALKQGIAKLIQDQDDPDYDFTEDETTMLQAFQDTLNDFQKQLEESTQEVNNNKTEAIQSTVDSENTESVHTHS
jgi:predicted  nucleic acid-binding Zn-ribbon protein